MEKQPLKEEPKDTSPKPKPNIEQTKKPVNSNPNKRKFAKHSL